MLQTEPSFDWSHALLELSHFLASFLVIGAVGFRITGLRGRPAATAPFAEMERRAALIGLVGAIGGALRFAYTLPRAAARAETTVTGALLSGSRTTFDAAFVLLVLIGFALVLGRIRWAWCLAAVGAFGPQIAGIISGRVGRMVNSTHLLAGGLWIGTLFVMVVAGLAVALRTPEGRGVALELVQRFSTLALGAVAVLLLSGVVTAYRHLDGWSSLFDNPYGNALLVKLGLVAVVALIGAWNWRRGTPAMESGDGAAALYRAARMEVGLAFLVLLVTSALVSFEAPAERRAEAAPPPTQIQP